jgi:hypothetical protein
MSHYGENMNSGLVSRPQDAPKDLTALSYAAWICENSLAIPAAKSNLEVISQAIEAVALTRYKDDRWKHKHFTAFIWLERQVRFARQAGTQCNHLFFLNGDYNEVPEPKIECPQFVPCQECNFGWKYQMRDGKSTGRVVACECRTKWVEENRK